MASALKNHNMVTEDVRIGFFDHPEDEVKPYLKEVDGIPFVDDFVGLFRYYGIDYEPKEWRLNIDGNTVVNTGNVKCCLLYDGKNGEDEDLLPSVPILVSKKHKENYEDLKEILKLINYDEHEWLICCDLKVVNILCGLGTHSSKFSCFLCTWVSTATEEHYGTEYSSREEAQIKSNDLPVEVRLSGVQS